jgi:hypothetical protein
MHAREFVFACQSRGCLDETGERLAVMAGDAFVGEVSLQQRSEAFR